MKKYQFAKAVSLTLVSGLVLAESSVKNQNVINLEEIAVQADLDKSRSTDPLSGTTKPSEIFISKEKLRKSAATLGNALSDEVGVHSSQFGGGSSAPVVRGQDGVRLKILQNNLDVVDMSALSPDHAVAADTLLAQQVEIVRGASTLLYASASPAGVINVIDNRIPTQVPDNGYALDLGFRYNTNNRENVENAALTLGLSKHLVLRAEGLKRHANDYKVPSLIFNDAPVNRLPNSFNHSKVGTVGLSWVADNGYFGVAYSERRDKYGLVGHNHKYDLCDGHIFEDGYNRKIGKTRYYLSLYPHLMDDQDLLGSVHFHGCETESTHTHSHNNPFGHPVHGNPYIDMLVKRWESRAEIRRPVAGIDKIRVNYAQTDYFHDEKESADFPINQFRNRGKNLRLEVFHQPFGGLSGLIGVQYQTQTSSAFVPRLERASNQYKPGVNHVWQRGEVSIGKSKKWALIENENKQFSVFLFEQLRWRDFLFEAAARAEKQRIDIDYDKAALAKLRQRSSGGSSGLLNLWGSKKNRKLQDPDLSPYNKWATSYSAGAHWYMNDNYTLSLAASHNERHPTPMELYYHGNHAATNSFDYGNKNLKKEVSNNLELTLAYDSARWQAYITAYYSRFDNRIFKRTLRRSGNLLITRYAQAKGDYYGVEGKFDYRLSERTQLGIWGDYVRGVLRDLPQLVLEHRDDDYVLAPAGKDAPRVSPARLGVHWTQQFSDALGAKLKWTHVFAQRRVAALENSTDGYNLLDLELNYARTWQGVDYALFINANNLLNQKIYSHTSFLPFVPQMGRSVTMGINLSF
ncbi:TonB-dependent receptor [Necropsobacter rosorum]|uniref:TonB-dependent receptor n=1 Tax=Necropsobacter rosorum TaxID=908285 RepID=UPI00050971D9